MANRSPGLASPASTPGHLSGRGQDWTQDNEGEANMSNLSKKANEARRLLLKAGMLAVQIRDTFEPGSEEYDQWQGVAVTSGYAYARTVHEEGSCPECPPT